MRRKKKPNKKKKKKPKPKSETETQTENQMLEKKKKRNKINPKKGQGDFFFFSWGFEVQSIPQQISTTLNISLFKIPKGKIKNSDNYRPSEIALLGIPPLSQQKK